MYSRKQRVKKLAIDILLMLIGLGILVVVLYAFQTSFTLKNQRENSKIKFEIAAQRMETHATEAEEYLDRYDAFTQAKADSIAYFYSENPDQTSGLAEMADEWGLKELFIVDSAHNILQSNNAETKDFSDSGEFATLFSEGENVVVEDVRYYTSVISDGMILVAGRDCTDCMAYIDNVTSLSTSLSTMRVGRSGHIEAISKEDNTILYAPDSRTIGKTLEEAGFNKKSFKNGNEGWVRYNGESFYSECTSLDEDTLLISMVPRSEISQTDKKMVMLAATVFTIVLFILIIYIHLIRIEEAQQRAEREKIEYIRIRKNWYFNKTIGKRVERVIIIGLVVTFLLAFYVQTLGALSNQSARSDSKQVAIEEIFEENQEKVKSLTEEYNNEYLGRVQHIAYLLKLDPRLVDDDKLTTLAKKAQIRMIYVFNEKGAVDATNAVYKDFVLSMEESDQSYEFWDIIRGYSDTIIQEATKDDVSGEYVQYVGCTRQDAKGLVQLGISPQRLENRLRTVRPVHVLGKYCGREPGILGWH